MGSVTRSVRGASWWQENLSGKPCQETSPVLTVQVLKMQEVMLVLVAAALGKSLDLGSSGVYDSPMAQDYYVKRFGFLFGGGRSGMSGLKALQEHGLVELDTDLDLVVEMKNSMDSYYKEAMPNTVTEPPRKYRTLSLSREKVMVELPPKMMGDINPKMFYPFLAVP